MALKPAAEDLIVRISRAGTDGLSLSSDAESYRIALRLRDAGLVEFVRRQIRTVSVRWTVRLTGKGEQVAAAIADSRLDEINRSEPA